MERRLSAIMAADVVGYSRLMGANEVGTLQSLQKHQAELIQPEIAQRPLHCPLIQVDLQLDLKADPLQHLGHRLGVVAGIG